MKKNDLSKRLDDMADGFPGGRKGWSLRSGLNETAVRDAIRHGNPTVETVLALARAANVSPAYLLFGEHPPESHIPVQGIVSAGEGWEIPDGARFDPVEFTVDGTDVFAIEIRGDSMTPVYRSGDFLICSRHTGVHLDNLIGLDCVVLTAGGKGFVKILKRGLRPHRFTLKSYNPRFDDIENVELKWAAPIQWVKRGRR